MTIISQPPSTPPAPPQQPPAPPPVVIATDIAASSPAAPADASQETPPLPPDARVAARVTQVDAAQTTVTLPDGRNIILETRLPVPPQTTVALEVTTPATTDTPARVDVYLLRPAAAVRPAADTATPPKAESPSLPPLREGVETLARILPMDAAALEAIRLAVAQAKQTADMPSMATEDATVPRATLETAIRAAAALPSATPIDDIDALTSAISAAIAKPQAGAAPSPLSASNSASGISASATPAPSLLSALITLADESTAPTATPALGQTLAAGSAIPASTAPSVFHSQTRMYAPPLSSPASLMMQAKILSFSPPPQTGSNGAAGLPISKPSTPAIAAGQSTVPSTPMLAGAGTGAPAPTNSKPSPMPSAPSLPVTGEILMVTAEGRPLVLADGVLLILDTHAPQSATGQPITLTLQPAGQSAPVDASHMQPQAGRPFMPAFTDIAFLPTALPQSWPALEETLAALSAMAPAAAANVRSSVPQPSAQLVPAALFFMAALKGGALENWIGDKTLAPLKMTGKSGLLQRLSADFAELSRQSDTPGGEWRSVTLPFMQDEHITKMQLLTRQFGEDDQSGGEDGGGKALRFILNLTFTNLGPLQIDGYIRGKSLDTVLRSADKLDDTARQEVMRRYASALDHTGMTGQISFQAGASRFIDVSGADHGHTEITT